MRALTLTQPWCGLVASGIKLVENRPRRMIKREDFGKPFALHASREIDKAVYQRARDIAPEILGVKTEAGDRAYRLGQITSAVIAVATIVREVCLDDWRMFVPDDQRRWFFGPIGYVLCDVQVLPVPITSKGMLGFWKLSPAVEAGVVGQVKP